MQRRSNSLFPRGGINEGGGLGRRILGRIAAVANRYGGGGSGYRSASSYSSASFGSSSTSSSSCCWWMTEKGCDSLGLVFFSCCRGRILLALSSLVAVCLLLLLVFQGQSLLMDKCLIPSLTLLPRDDLAANLLWDLWLEIDLGDCPGATTTPRFSWLTEDGRLHMTTDSCTNPRYSYAFSSFSSTSSSSSSPSSLAKQFSPSSSFSSSKHSSTPPSSPSSSSPTSVIGIAGGERSFQSSPNQPIFIEHEFVRTSCTFPAPIGTQSNILVHCRKKSDVENRIRGIHSTSSPSSPSPSSSSSRNKTEISSSSSSSSSSPSSSSFSSSFPLSHGINVVVLHISSLSAAHFNRMFPLTTKYLQSPRLRNEAGAEVFQMNGFTSLGLDPLQSQLPLFLGARLKINTPQKEGTSDEREGEEEREGRRKGSEVIEPFTIIQDEYDEREEEEKEEEEEEKVRARKRREEQAQEDRRR
jgi:hypothetical protein